MSSDRLTHSLGRLRRLPLWLRDAGVGGIFVVGVTAEAVHQPVAGGRTTIFAVLTAALAVSLWLRRTAPLAALAIGIPALVAESFLHIATDFTPLASLVSAYSVGLYATARRARWGLVIIVAGIVGYFVGTPGLRRTEPEDLAYVLLVWLAGWAVGYTTARRREDLDRARRALERQLIAEERVRMSRELHDIVGHTVNLLVVQAGAARMTLDQDPAQARELLKTMEKTGRETLADLDRALAMLRTDIDEGGREPDTPVFTTLGLTQLPELIGRFRDSGVDARLSVEPGLRLPRDVDSAAYRIVQEALTNSLKHAAPCSATVVVERVDGSVTIEVSDTGPGISHTDPHGRGLVGMAERVSMCGGVLEYGDGEHGGFRLRAVVPLA